MAGVTGRGESALSVIGVGRRLIVLQVAGRTGPGGQVVVAIHVALRALQFGVRAGQGKSRACVIEGSARPGGRVVASLAGLRKLGLHMIGIVRALIILQMAGHASGCGQVVIIVYVALRALHCGVRTGQRKSYRAMVEVCRTPGCRVVA